jgi:putative colanic acid biosynthesis acetyltransferase WcaF
LVTRVRNDLFDPREGLQRGRPLWIEALWYLVKCFVFLSSLPWPSPFKCALLRLFGAEVGRNVYIKPRVNIHFPWKVRIGDHTWIGEEVFLLNFEPIVIGAHCCISQRAFICTGNHDFRKPQMPYRNRPIAIQDGAWVGAQVFVAPGITIGSDAVVSAGSIVTGNVPSGMICCGNPCRPTKPRWGEETRKGQLLAAVTEHESVR